MTSTFKSNHDIFASPATPYFTEVRFDEMLEGTRGGVNFRFGNRTIHLTEPCFKWSFYDPLDKYKLTIFCQDFLVERYGLPLYKRQRIRGPSTTSVTPGALKT